MVFLDGALLAESCGPNSLPSSGESVAPIRENGTRDLALAVATDLRVVRGTSRAVSKLDMTAHPQEAFNDNASIWSSVGNSLHYSAVLLLSNDAT